MSELKPCPFCGGEPEIINRSVHCNSASCNAQPFTSWWANDDAIAAWNRRAEDAALSRLRETQRVLVEALRGLVVEVREKARHGHPASKYWDSVRVADAALASVEQPQSDPAQPSGEEVTAAARDVLAERQRQISAEGWTPEHDDHHHTGDLAAAAACYASPHRAFKAVQGVGRGYESLTVYRDLWPWRDEWWKPKDRRSNLVRAGALILAEIERLDRAAMSTEPKP